MKGGQPNASRPLSPPYSIADAAWLPTANADLTLRSLPVYQRGFGAPTLQWGIGLTLLRTPASGTGLPFRARFTTDPAWLPTTNPPEKPDSSLPVKKALIRSVNREPCVLSESAARHSVISRPCPFMAGHQFIHPAAYGLVRACGCRSCQHHHGEPVASLPPWLDTFGCISALWALCAYSLGLPAVRDLDIIQTRKKSQLFCSHFL